MKGVSRYIDNVMCTFQERAICLFLVSLHENSSKRESTQFSGIDNSLGCPVNSVFTQKRICFIPVINFRVYNQISLSLEAIQQKSESQKSHQPMAFCSTRIRPFVRRLSIFRASPAPITSKDPVLTFDCVCDDQVGTSASASDLCSQERQRLDAYLARKITSTTRSQIAHSIKTGSVLINSHPCTKPSYSVKPGDVIHFELEQRIPSEVQDTTARSPVEVPFADHS